MASGDWGLTVTKGKGRFTGTVLWVLHGQQGKCMLLERDGLTFSAFPGEATGQTPQKVRMRKGWCSKEMS